MSATASEKIAEFVTRFTAAAITSEHRHVAKRALYDTLVSALAGVNEPASKLISGYARGHTAPCMATVWATGERLPVDSAALVNGTMGHALDFDDVASPLRGHPSVAIFPALLALGESEGSTGRDVLDAYIAGFEVTLKIARAIVDDQYAKGWHSTASIATFGATSACAHLLRLDMRQTVWALGLAVSQVAGTRQNFGTMAKPFQAGQANAVAVRSVLLARMGFDASPGAMDGSQGYTVLYADGQDISSELDCLGQAPLEIERSGIEIKKYPLCYATHRAIQGVLEIKSETPFTLADVRRVEVKTNYRATVPLIHHRPKTGLEGKFSMEYAIAAAIQDGRVTLETFDDEAVNRREIQDFFPKVHLSQGEPPTFPRWTELGITLHDGTAINRRIEKLRGSAVLPLTDDELMEKGADCCAFGNQDLSAVELADACFEMGDAPITDFLNILRR